MDVRPIRHRCYPPLWPLRRFLGVLLMGVLISLPAQGFFGLDYYVSRQGSDSEGNEDNKTVSGELDNAAGGNENADFLGGGDSLSGAVFSAGGPVGVSLLASYGYLRAEASAGGSTSQGFAGVTTHAFSGALDTSGTAQFEDWVTITAPGMEGLSGTFTAHFIFDPHVVLDGFVIPDNQSPGFQVVSMLFADANASWRLNEERGSYSYWRSLDNIEEETFNDFPEEEVSVVVPFTYGDAFRVRFRIDVTALIDAWPNGFAQGRATASFPGSVQWLGMTGLPANATVSGKVDWTSAAPIPDGEDDPPTEGDNGGNGSSQDGSNQSGSKKSGGALFASIPWLIGLLCFVRFRAVRVRKARAS